jgi:hypothetical protein
MIIDQIAVALGFEFEDKDKLDSFNRQIKETGKDLAKLGAVAVGFASGIGVLVHKISQMNAELGRSARVLGVSASELSAYKDAVNTVMGGSNEIVGALKNIQSAAVSAWVSGGEVAAAYAHLGVKTHTMTGQLRDSMDILMDVADALQGLPRQQQLWRLQQLGLTEYIALFDKGKAGIQAMIREQDKWKITDAQVKSSQQFEATFARFGTVIRWLTNIFVEHLQPALEDMMNAFMEFVEANKEWIKRDIAAVAKAIGISLKILAGFVIALGVAFAALNPILTAFIYLTDGAGVVYLALAGFIGVVIAKLFLLYRAFSRAGKAVALLNGPSQFFANVLSKIGPMISSLFSGIAGWIARIGPMLARIGSLFASMWGWIARIGAGIMAWAGGVTAGALLALQAAIVAVFAAWYLFYDSLKEFMGLSTGSVIGNLRKEFAGFTKVLDMIFSPLLAIFTLLKFIFKLLTGQWKGAWTDFAAEMGGVWDAMIAPIMSLWATMKEFWAWLGGGEQVKKSMIIAQKLESDGVTDPNFAAGVAGASSESVSTERKYSYDNANSVKKHEYGGSVDFNVNITGDAKNLDKRELQANIQGYLSEKQTEAMRALNSQRRQ